MSRKTRSARGNVVDFDLLAIKEQLAAKPVPVGVNDRRRFIDEKDGVRTRKVTEPVEVPVPAALAIAAEAVQTSAKSAKAKPVTKSSEE
jgi:hypothetical protein